MSSLLEKVHAQQTKRQQSNAPDLQIIEQSTDAQPAARPAAARRASGASAVNPMLDISQKRETRQLGYRVSAEIVQQFEAYLDQLNALAREHGIQRQSYGDLAELALKLLMAHEPREVFGLS